MNEFQATAVLVGLFVLRCVVPFVLLLVIGYGMNRLVAHWEREEKGRQAAEPSIPLAVAAPAAPTTPSRIPCWVFNNCDERQRAGCPAYASPSLACWVARLRAEGRLPAKCAGCPLYTNAPAHAAGD